MATVAERVGVLEIKVQHVDEKIDDLKVDVKDMHDCLDRTRDTLSETLSAMRQESTNQHNELAGKVAEIQKSKDKMMLYGAMAAAFLAGAGWLGHIDVKLLFKFLGM